MFGVPFDPRERVRVAIVGLGSRQSRLLKSLEALDQVDIVALCDVNTDLVTETTLMLASSGRQEPAAYGGCSGFERLLAASIDADIAMIATPWQMHTPMAVAAMDAGMHVAVEVPAAVTIEECWQLVNTSERTRRHCVMLENCCYGRDELMALNMVRSGLLGQLVHGDASYIHDLRGYLMTKRWRREARTRRNGNLYPTHGLGPVANYMDINRGDQFALLGSLSSASVGLEKLQSEHNLPTNDTYLCGDMNVSIIRTKLGKTIMLQHDEISPRPYTRHNVISGTNGFFSGASGEAYIQLEPPVIGRDSVHNAVPIEHFREQFEHAIWRERGEQARGSSHGGMDYLMLWRLTQAMVLGVEPDMDVYDAAALSAAGPLSEKSNEMRTFVEFPDFTRGRWTTRRTSFGEHLRHVKD